MTVNMNGNTFSVLRRCGKSLPPPGFDCLDDSHEFEAGMAEFDEYEASQAMFEDEEEDDGVGNSPLRQVNQTAR